jgi:hypothetical protein
MSNGFVFRPISQRVGAWLVFVAILLLLPPPVGAQSSSGQSGSGQSGSGQPGSGQSGSGQSGSGQSDDKESKSSGQSDKNSKSSSPGDKGGQSDKDTTPKAQSGSNADAQADAKTDRDTKSDASDGYSKLRVQITGGDTNKPIGNASVYVRYDEAPSGLLHKTHQAELNFKSNQDGTVKVPSVPRGKVLIQVIAPGWHTYGEWYDVTKDEQLIDIHLAKPPRWY